MTDNPPTTEVCDWGKCKEKPTHKFLIKESNPNVYWEMCQLHTLQMADGYNHDGLYHKVLPLD